MSGLTSIRSSSAITTVPSAMIEPTDRSMPPATITIVMPTAAMLTIAVCRAISSRLAGREKLRADERAEHDGDEHQAEQRAGALEQRSRRHAPGAPPVAAIISSCSDERRRPDAAGPAGRGA